MCDNEITIKPEGCDFMNYNETVEKVMMLLKEKEVCSNSQKSHRDCYKSLGLFIKQRDGNYSEVIRENWLWQRSRMNYHGKGMLYGYSMHVS